MNLNIEAVLHDYCLSFEWQTRCKVKCYSQETYAGAALFVSSSFNLKLKQRYILNLTGLSVEQPLLVYSSITCGYTRNDRPSTSSTHEPPLRCFNHDSRDGFYHTLHQTLVYFKYQITGVFYQIQEVDKAFYRLII